MTGKKLIVSINIQEYIEKKKLRTSVDFYAVLEKKMKRIIDKAAERSKSNFRRTIMAKDL